MPQFAIFGRYWPGSSVLHRMDPRAKLLFALLMIVLIFCAFNPFSLIACGIFVVSLFAVARIPFSKALKSIAPLLFVIIIAFLLNMFTVQGGHVFISWGIFQISEEGLGVATFVGFRLLLLLLSVSLLTLTTTVLDITDAFEKLLMPFTRIGVPAHELAMIMGIALRFVPQFATEIKTIYQAQVSRGAQFSKGSPFKRVRFIGSLIIPLFSSAFRHAETLSYAMDARCYHGGPGRTRLYPLHYSSLDRNAIIAMTSMFALVIAINIAVNLL